MPSSSDQIPTQPLTECEQGRVQYLEFRTLLFLNGIIPYQVKHDHA